MELENRKPIPEDELEQLRRLITQSYWRDSTTYPPDMQHAYCMRDAYPQTYDALKKALDDYGFDAMFFKVQYRYLVIDEYKYWAYDTLVNREHIRLTGKREKDARDG